MLAPMWLPTTVPQRKNIKSLLTAVVLLHCCCCELSSSVVVLSVFRRRIIKARAVLRQDSSSHDRKDGLVTLSSSFFFARPVAMEQALLENTYSYSLPVSTYPTQESSTVPSTDSSRPDTRIVQATEQKIFGISGIKTAIIASMIAM